MNSQTQPFKASAEPVTAEQTRQKVKLLARWLVETATKQGRITKPT